MINYESYRKELDKRRQSRATVVQCSTCDNHEELSGEITAQTLIDDNWLLEPIVYCPRCGEDDQKEGDSDVGTGIGTTAE